MSKLRLNVQLDESFKQYCAEQAELLGISMSGFISVALAQYRQQQEAMKAMSDMTNYTKLVEEKFDEIKKMIPIDSQK